MDTSVPPYQLPPIEDARRSYVELFGSALVLNTYLKIALLCVSLVAVGLLVLNFRTQAKAERLKPLVIRIDDVGRAQAVQYDTLTYQPQGQAPELKYFLTQFVTKHFARMKATVQERYAESLYFLDAAIADATIAQNQRTQAIQTFLSGASDEIEIQVKNVTLDELKTAPYKAAVDFDKVYYSLGSRQERKRETFVAQLTFVLRDQIPGSRLPSSRLGRPPVGDGGDLPRGPDRRFERRAHLVGDHQRRPPAARRPGAGGAPHDSHLRARHQSRQAPYSDRRGRRRFAARHRRTVVDKREHLFSATLAGWTWYGDETGLETWTHWSTELEETLRAATIAFRTYEVPMTTDEVDRRARFEAVKRWFEDDWMRIEPKLRTSIVEGISVFLSLFDDNPKVKYAFCPPKETYDPVRNADGLYGRPLPPLGALIDQGKVVALNFPVATNPGLARALGTMLKQDFQRAVLNRIPTTSEESQRPMRAVTFVCEEYQAFATTGENEPSGDEKFWQVQRLCSGFPGSRRVAATRHTSSHYPRLVENARGEGLLKTGPRPTDALVEKVNAEKHGQSWRAEDSVQALPAPVPTTSSPTDGIRPLSGEALFYGRVTSLAVPRRQLVINNHALCGFAMFRWWEHSMKRTLLLLLTIFIFHGCGPVERLQDSVDKAIAVLETAIVAFVDQSHKWQDTLNTAQRGLNIMADERIRQVSQEISFLSQKAIHSVPATGGCAAEFYASALAERFKDYIPYIRKTDTTLKQQLVAGCDTLPLTSTLRDLQSDKAITLFGFGFQSVFGSPVDDSPLRVRLQTRSGEVSYVEKRVTINSPYIATVNLTGDRLDSDLRTIEIVTGDPPRRLGATDITGPAGPIPVHAIQEQAVVSNWPEAVAKLSDDYWLVGGGCATSFSDTSPKHLLVYSFPTKTSDDAPSENAWRCRARQHSEVIVGGLTAYVLGVPKNLYPGMEVVVTQGTGVKAHETYAKATVKSGYRLIGGGCKSSFDDQHATHDRLNLTRSYQTSPTDWTCSGNVVIGQEFDGGSLTAYAIGLKGDGFEVAPALSASSEKIGQYVQAEVSLEPKNEVEAKDRRERGLLEFSVIGGGCNYDNKEGVGLYLTKSYPVMKDGIVRGWRCAFTDHGTIGRGQAHASLIPVIFRQRSPTR